MEKENEKAIILGRQIPIYTVVAKFLYKPSESTLSTLYLWDEYANPSDRPT